MAWQAVIEAEVWQAVTAATALRAVIAARASRGVMAEAVSPRATEVAAWTTATVRTEEQMVRRERLLAQEVAQRETRHQRGRSSSVRRRTDENSTGGAAWPDSEVR